MRKLFVIATMVLASYTFASAQEVGVRFGDVSGGNVAIDALFSTGKFSRIHADISFGDGVGIDVLWDFLYRPLGGEDFNWYVGVGPYIFINDPFWFGAVGELGLEYRFQNIPISLSFDWRPQLSIIEVTDLHMGGFGLNIRYVIGE